MSIIRIGHFDYDTEDRVELCLECDGWYYNQPSLVNFLKITEQERQDLLVGKWGIGFCPVCQKVKIWRK